MERGQIEAGGMKELYATMEGSPHLLYLSMPPPAVTTALCLTAMIAQHRAIWQLRKGPIGQLEGEITSMSVSATSVAIPPWPGVAEMQRYGGR